MPDDKQIPEKKSFLDNLFDVADSALGGLESALKPGEKDKAPEPKKVDDIEDAEFTDTPNQRKKDWESTWSKEMFWATALDGKLGEAHHLFPEGSLTAVCGNSFNSHEVTNRRKLEHGKRIVACTSCIIEASRHG